MALFSERKGLKPLKKPIQYEEFDEETRNQFWTVLSLTIFQYYSPPNYLGTTTLESNRAEALIRKVWMWYFKRPIDILQNPNMGIDQIRSTIIKGKWNDILDLMEFIIKNYDEIRIDGLRDFLNEIFESESCGYRFVNNEISEITDPNEIKSIEEATETNDVYSKHIERSLELLTDRKNHDYRNSIKESISAVEAICRDICGNKSATLGEALKHMRSTVVIQPAFEQAMSKLYGFTSEAGGIRHSLTDKSVDISFYDAKYFLVICSAFINYLKALL